MEVWGRAGGLEVWEGGGGGRWSAGVEVWARAGQEDPSCLRSLGDTCQPDPSLMRPWWLSGTEGAPRPLYSICVCVCVCVFRHNVGSQSNKKF